MARLFLKFLAWFKPSQEQEEAAIRSAMWVDGYSDYEIDQVIADLKRQD
jgi:hypothetical protein